MKRIRDYIDERLKKSERPDKARLLRVYSGRADIRLVGGTVYRNVKVIGGTSKLRKGDIVSIEWRYNQKAKGYVPVVLGSGGLEEKVQPQDISNASATPSPGVIVMTGPSGTIHLGFLPPFLEGKSADMVDGKHANEFALANHSHTFLSLTDTPNSYLGQANKVLTVNAAETGIVFSDAVLQSLSSILSFWYDGTVKSYEATQTGLQNAINDAPTSSAVTVIQLPPFASINLNATIAISKNISITCPPVLFHEVSSVAHLRAAGISPVFSINNGTVFFLSNVYLYSSHAGNYNDNLSILSIGNGAFVRVRNALFSIATTYANCVAITTSGNSSDTEVNIEHTKIVAYSQNGSATGAKIYAGNLLLQDCNISVTCGNYGTAVGLDIGDASAFKNRILDSYIAATSGNTAYGLRTYT